MKKFLLIAIIGLTNFLYSQEREAPAYPLITHDPYLSIWSFTDKINTQPTKHWTGTDHDLLGYINVDGTNYRFLGSEVRNYQEVLSASDQSNYQARISESQPPTGWEKSNFDDKNWKTASAPFGDTPQATTPWESDNLWLRRKFDLDQVKDESLYLKLSHDDNVEVFLNGEQIFSRNGWNHKYEYFKIPQSAVNKLKPKDNILAVHVKNSAGGQFLDVGIVREIEDKSKKEIAEQLSVEFKATQTEYVLRCGGVDVNLTFTSPLLMDDLDVLARPVSYISIKTTPNDNKPHEVQVYFGASTSIAVNESTQAVTAESSTTDELSFLKAGTKAQEILEKKGDDLRIDWGYLYIAAPKDADVKQTISQAKEAFDVFRGSEIEIATEGKNLMLNTLFPKTKVTSEKDHLVLLGYDDIFSINYFGKNLRPWWNSDGNNTLENELSKAYQNYSSIIEKCEEFDKKLYEDGVEAGGENYAELLEIAYRQSIAAHKLVKSPEGEILFLSKENNSNGSINTVDVTYPSAPLYLLYNPDLLKGMLNGIFYYSESGKWKKPFPAHDLGTYPIATGQTYPEDMPVEEAGNMIILTAAIAKAEGNADYAKEHWESLTLWANYLAEKGLDPANQLSTDDFSGHLARNANLSVKAIVAIGSYGYLAKQLGELQTAEKYSQMAKSMAKKWMELADAGDHYSLTFDDKSTWSQKYNLIWDKVLDFNIFPQEVIDEELKFYVTKINEYGLPLDNRSDYTKSDWILWTATLSEDDSIFKKIAAPVYKFAVESDDRVPMSDWHFTTSGDVTGFKARSVVGGYFIKLLQEEWE